MDKQKRIGLIAHDNLKPAIVEWAKTHYQELSQHLLFGTGTTGALIQRETGLKITCFKSGPLGGDQQIGAKIVDGEIDVLIFFWDPMSPHPHDVDVKALLRIAVVYDVPIACNQATADFLIRSPAMGESYNRPSRLP